MINEDYKASSPPETHQGREIVNLAPVDAKSAEDHEAKVRDSDKLQPSGGKSSSKKEFEGDVEINDDVALTFPQALMEILDDEENAEIVSWLPHGRGFAIFRKKAFEQNVLPRYFSKQSKYSSFTRKLNRWGFVRVTRGPETGAYYHPCFKRGCHRLCMQMSCQSGSKSSAATKRAPPEHPNSSAPSLSSIYDNVPFSATVTESNPLVLQQQQLAQLQMQQQMQQQLQQQQLIQQEIMRRSILNNPDLYSQMVGNQDRTNVAPASMEEQLFLARMRQMNGGSMGGPGINPGFQNQPFPK